MCSNVQTYSATVSPPSWLELTPFRAIDLNIFIFVWKQWKHGTIVLVYDVANIALRGIFYKLRPSISQIYFRTAVAKHKLMWWIYRSCNPRRQFWLDTKMKLWKVLVHNPAWATNLRHVGGTQNVSIRKQTHIDLHESHINSSLSNFIVNILLLGNAAAVKYFIITALTRAFSYRGGICITDCFYCAADKYVYLILKIELKSIIYNKNKCVKWIYKSPRKNDG